MNFKRTANLLGASLAMGIGAFSMGSLYVMVYEKITGKPLN